MSENTALAVREPASSNPVSVWQSPASFEAAQRMANALVQSDMVPEAYRGNMGNALIALDISQRVNASPLMVMQNLDIIQGRPSWRSQFIIAALNSCGKFSPIRFRMTDCGEVQAPYTEWTGSKSQGNLQRVNKTLKVRNIECMAYAIEKATGEVLEGPTVSIAMAVAEGWYTKRDSKWPTMGELMLRYRAAAFFGRLYAPDLLMGMSTGDELRDIDDVEYTEVRPVSPQPEPAAKPGRASRVAAAMASTPAEPAKPEPAKVSSGRSKPKDEPKQAAQPEPLRDTNGQVEDDDHGGDIGSGDGEGYGYDQGDGEAYAERDGDPI